MILTSRMYGKHLLPPEKFLTATYFRPHWQLRETPKKNFYKYILKIYTIFAHCRAINKGGYIVIARNDNSWSMLNFTIFVL